MEFKISNIEETLEKSRKVLMNSIEINNNSFRTPLLDRTKEIKSRDNEEPEYYRIYLDKMKYLSSLKAKDHERKAEIEKFSTSVSPSFQELDFKNQTIDKLRLELEKNSIHQENEELRRKINNLQKENPESNRLKKALFEVKQEKMYLEEKYANEYNTVNKSEIIEIKNKVKFLQEKSQKKFQDLTNKLENLLRENSDLNNILTPHQRNEHNIEKYKIMVKSLKKKLKIVTKKYSELKKKDSNTSVRHQSACRKRKVKNTENGKSNHFRGKSTERNITPKRS